MTRRLVTMLCLAFAAPAFSAPLADVTHAYDPSLQHFDQSFQMALIDSGWIPLAVTDGEVTAETHARGRYAKVRIRFGNGKATFTLLESKGLDQGDCEYSKGAKKVRGPCIDSDYYGWLERVMAAIPRAHARMALVRSLAGPATGSKP